MSGADEQCFSHSGANRMVSVAALEQGEWAASPAESFVLNEDFRSSQAVWAEVDALPQHLLARTGISTADPILDDAAAPSPGDCKR